MNNEMRLARVDLGEGWIDLGYGEPVIVREILLEYIKKGGYLFDVADSKSILESSCYQPPKGNTKLVKLLENKYGTDVVVSNGAKQGIAAVMYALNKLGHSECVVPTPYWTSTPTIVRDAGLHVECLSTGSLDTARAVIITSPNNPDGREASKKQLVALSKEARKVNCMLIHDAAYYTPIYMEKPNQTAKIGDAQIYSFSKMWGFSGLRIGYVVIHNKDLLPHVIEYIERSCSGVSTASQQLAYDIENYFSTEKKLLKEFHLRCREAIKASRKELMNVNNEVLQVMPCSSNSMFAWCKAGPKLDFNAAKVNMMTGDIFGMPGYVRINLAVNSDLIKTAVDRLNNGGTN